MVAVFVAAAFFMVAPGLAAQQTAPVGATPASEAREAPPTERVDMLFFDWNSAKISAESASTLDKLVARRSGQPVRYVEVRGFSDRSGPRSSELQVARRRAGAVRDYLLQHGVTQDIRLVVPRRARPLIPTADGVREVQNRRVEIRWVD